MEKKKKTPRKQLKHFSFLHQIDTEHVSCSHEYRRREGLLLAIPLVRVCLCACITISHFISHALSYSLSRTLFHTHTHTHTHTPLSHTYTNTHTDTLTTQPFRFLLREGPSNLVQGCARLVVAGRAHEAPASHESSPRPVHYQTGTQPFWSRRHLPRPRA